MWYYSMVIAVTVRINLVVVPVKSQILPYDDNFPNTRQILRLPSHGGQDGTVFDDIKSIANASILKIHSIDIGSLYQVDYLQVTYLLSNGSFYKAPIHGDGIFTPDTITLAADEYVEKIEGKTNGEYVNEMTITTYMPLSRSINVYGPYGTPKLNATQSYIFEGNIVGFHGSAGKYVLSSLGVYIMAPVEKSPYFGYSNASSGFSDDPDGCFPPVVKISKLFIQHGSQINSIQAEYQLLGGGIQKGDRHGGKGGNLTVLKFASDEHLIGFKGKVDDSPLHVVVQLTFITISEKRKTSYYGPYGTTGSDSFSFILGRAHKNMIGLAGAASDVLEGFQVLYCE